MTQQDAVPPAATSAVVGMPQLTAAASSAVAAVDAGTDDAQRQVDTTVALADATKALNDANSARDDRDLKKLYGVRLWWLLVITLGLADAVFIVYSFANGWHIPASAIEAWLSASVVEVVSLVAIVVHYLFPRRDR